MNVEEIKTIIILVLSGVIFFKFKDELLTNTTGGLREKYKEKMKQLRMRTGAMEASIDGIAILNENQEYIYMNKAHAKIYGYNNANELIGESWHIFYDSEEIKRFKEDIIPKFTQQGYWRGRAIGLKRDGNKFPQEMSLTALDNGKLVCVVRDITKIKETEKRLVKNKNYLKSIINSVPDIIILMNTEGKYLNVWTSKHEDLVAPKQELIGKNISEILPAKIANKFKKYSSLTIKHDTLQTFEYKLEFDGNKRYFEAHFVSHNKVGADDKEILVTIRNVTDRKKTKKELKQTKNRLEMAIEGANLGLWDWNIKKSKIEFNERWAEMLDYDPEEINNSIDTWKELIHEDDKKRVFEELNKHLEGSTQYYKAEHRLKTRSGSYKWINSIGKVFKRDEKGNPVRAVGIHQDIDNRKKKEEKIRYLSFHDGLTGLYNRRYFENEIKRLNNSRRIPVSIIIGDMDKLKLINDNYGHKVGDEFLKKVSKIFDKVTRNEDVVARIGGDEFAVILPETDLSIAQKVCERIQNKTRQYNKKEELPEPLQISLGYAVKKEKDRDLNEIFNKADQQMYEIKNH